MHDSQDPIHREPRHRKVTKGKLEGDVKVTTRSYSVPSSCSDSTSFWSHRRGRARRKWECHSERGCSPIGGVVGSSVMLKQACRDGYHGALHVKYITSRGNSDEMPP